MQETGLEKNMTMRERLVDTGTRVHGSSKNSWAGRDTCLGDFPNLGEKWLSEQQGLLVTFQMNWFRRVGSSSKGLEWGTKAGLW